MTRTRWSLSALILLLFGASLAWGAPKALPEVSLEPLGEGKALNTSSLVGKPTLLAFFTPTCPYCRDELVLLESLRSAYPPEKLAMLAVTPSGSPKTLSRTMLSRWKVTTIPGYQDPKNALFDAFEVEGVPFTVLTDRKGRVVRTFLGLMPKEELTAALDKAIR